MLISNQESSILDSSYLLATLWFSPSVRRGSLNRVLRNQPPCRFTAPLRGGRRLVSKRSRSAARVASWTPWQRMDQGTDIVLTHPQDCAQDRTLCAASGATLSVSGRPGNMPQKAWQAGQCFARIAEATRKLITCESATNSS